MRSREVVLCIVVVALAAGCGAPVQPTVSWQGPPVTPVDPGRAPANPGPRVLTVLGSGDVLLHDALWTQAQRDAGDAGGYDFRPLFASVRPVVVAADLAICHLETPLGPPDGPFHNYPIFSVPPQVVPALADLGYDSCSTASNHALDQGEAGVVRTLDDLDAAGIHHAGTARSLVEAQTPTLLTVNRTVVAHLSYTWSFNGLLRPPGKEWLANLLDVDEILAQARLARVAGAEIVIVSTHFGTEYQHSADPYQTEVAHQLLASPDVDLVLGAHVHVVQPIERVGDKWVAYGMGNQVAWQNQAYDTRDGIMPRFTFTEVSPEVFKVTRAEVIPTHMWLDGAPARLYDINAALADPQTPAAIRASCEASLRRTRGIIDELGALENGLEFVGADRV
jgi:poly-gamma-glutamate capsule biosynthesis protein CapA/YwtB (metallophosphatase superfamily)